MPSSRSVQFRWPPPPCVEEETTSLARELHGLSKLGERPGVEGARRRGTVDQYPVIVNPESPHNASEAPSSCSNIPSLDHASSDDNSIGPRTPSPLPSVSESVLRSALEITRSSRSEASSASSREMPPSSMSQRRVRPSTHIHQQSQRELDGPRQSHAATHMRDNHSLMERLIDEGSVYITPNTSHSAGTSRSMPRGPDSEQSSLPTPRTSLGRSNSARYAPLAIRPTPKEGRRTHTSGYLSDSATTRSRRTPHHPPAQTSTTTERPPLEKASGAPTVAERIEEKLRLRQALRDLGPLSNAESQAAAPETNAIKTAVGGSAPKSVPFPSSQRQSPASRPRATSTTSAEPPRPHVSRSTSRNRSSIRSSSSDEAQASSNRSSRLSSSVRFEDLPPKHGQTHVSSSGKPDSGQRSPNSGGLCLAPCPRSIPTAGYTDWYTLRGLTHLDICPSCMDQIVHSRFRDFFIQSPPKPSTQKTRCAFANPWIRLAWAQMVKKQHASLELLYQMTRPPPGLRPCPGRTVTDQTWHRVIDPDTGLKLPHFYICGTCARNVRILMPSHRDTFQPSPEPKERVCDFVMNSPRFVHFIDLLDRAATRAEKDPARRPDLRDFLAYARRKVALHDCRRDQPIMGTWHYIPALPEFSVCEDCYDEVVWPLAKAQHPIARMFSTSMRLLPGDGPNCCREASCQLYSARMRARFRDLVTKNDFQMLKSIALQRFEAERRFKDRREELLIAERKGYDCEMEMRKAIDEWRRWE